LLQILIYGFNCGHGFIKDDFVWIDNAVTDGKTDWVKPWRTHTGFFRPLIGVSFALQYRLFGLNPFPYGYFNLGLHLSILILLYLLLRRFPPTADLALTITLLFSMNAKAVRMAVCWISARTTLMCAAFLLLAFLAHRFLISLQKKGSGRIKEVATGGTISAFYFLSLLSKEEAVIAPLIVLAVYLWHRSNSGIRWWQDSGLAFRHSLPYLVSLTVYLWLRVKSEAFTPFQAPDYYQFTLSLVGFVKNLGEYLIRAALFDIYLILAIGFTLLLTGCRRLAWNRFDTKLTLFGVALFVILQLPTLFLPVRSDLYVYLSQAALHVGPARLLLQAARAIRAAGIRQRLTAMSVFLVLAAGWTIYLTEKAGEYRRQGEASSHFTATLRAEIPKMPAGQRLVILDTGEEGENAPIRTVSYGFPSWLAVTAPGKFPAGEIRSVPPDSQAPVLSGIVYRWKSGKLEPLPISSTPSGKFP